jgi:uncharacterized SAM-binding protein YcdF (DUF218 family)
MRMAPVNGKTYRRIGLGGLCLAFAAAAAVGWVYLQVSRDASRDEARPADAIVVLGAAQYYGRPSPVLKARLDHALELYERGLAPRIVVTGGHGPDVRFSEAEVSREYLSSRGVAAEYITVENSGGSTMQSIAAVVEIMDRMRMTSCIVVSDDYHIHRAKRMLAENGVEVYGSPRASRTIDEWARRKRFLRESVSYLLWRVGIRV